MRSGMRLLFLLCLFVASHSQAEQLPESAQRLNSAEIQQAFMNVIDTASVRDTDASVATNYWFAEGRFESHWSNSEEAGVVTGRWEVVDDRRCVTIATGIPALQGKRRCGPIYRLGEEYFSINADGSVHGIHRLRPLNQKPE